MRKVKILIKQFQYNFKLGGRDAGWEKEDLIAMGRWVKERIGDFFKLSLAQSNKIGKKI